MIPWDLLRRVDTPTVCNAIEVTQGKRGFAGFTRATPVAPKPGAVMVGYARTATIRGTRPPTEPPDEIRARRMAYFEHMAVGPRPGIAVVQDQDDEPLGAWWGEVHVAVHLGLGLNGALTNGLVRDLGDLDAGFPVVAGGIGPSHGFVHVTGIGETVEVMGLRVADGDLVHADRHGAVVIPPEVLPDLEKAIETLFASEALILGPAREEGFGIERLREAWAAFEKART